MWEEIKRLMPVTNDWIYLSTFEEAALPVVSGRKMSQLIRLQVENGVSKPPPRRDVREQIAKRISNLLGSGRKAGVFPFWNKGQAISFLLSLTNLPSGADVISNHEVLLDKSFNIIEVDTYLSPEILIGAITSNTKLVFIQDIDIKSGIRSPLGELAAICQRHGILFMVDCSYSVGVLEILPEELNIDLMVFDGSKWLLGPSNCVYAYVSDQHPKLRAKGTNLIESDLTNTTSVMEVGMYYSLRLLNQYSIQDIQNYVLLLTDQLAAGISELNYDLVSSRDSSNRSAMVYFTRADMEAVELRDRLLLEGITSGVMGDCNVLSPHIFITSQEIDRTLDILANI